MSAYDAADCLALFNRKAGRPTTDLTTPADKYDRLAKSQDRVIAEIAGVAPYALYPKASYGSYPTLTTADNQIFKFGSDSDGNPIAPMSAFIYPSLSSIPDSPWREGYDYLNEVTQIRIPRNNTYSGTLYWRGITTPTPISATTDPALFPIASRELIVIDAVRQYAEEGMRNPGLAAQMAQEWARAWPKWCLVWKTQFRNGGALAIVTGRQLAELTQAY